MMRLTFDLPQEQFDVLRQASLRRGLPLDQLIVAGLFFAATAV